MAIVGRDGAIKIRLENGKHGWVGRAVLPAWKGYLDRSGAYAGNRPSSSSDGAVAITASSESTDKLTGTELARIEWFLDNESAVSEALLAGIVRNYGKLQNLYGFYEKEKAEYMPDISSAGDLKRLIGLHAVHVHPIDRNGIPYLGFEFGCIWDDEHGLGVMMHGTRVVEVADAATAILLWIAERDTAPI